MRVHVYPADDQGCGSYRLIWAAQEARAAGHDVVLKDPARDGANLKTIMADDRILAVEPIDCEVAVFQRPLKRLLVDAIPYLQRQGIKVVVEIDDDFHAVHPQNAAWKWSMPKNSPDRNRDHLMRACQLADRVTVSTHDLLVRYGRDGGVVIPNYVPEWYLSVPKEFHDPNRVGWSGSIVTHPNDLQEMGSTFPYVARKGSDIYIAGTGKGVHRKTGMAPGFPIQCSGWVPLGVYPEQMAEIDVGVVPLEPTLFNHAKSWLKGLEFASLGVPFVASPTRPYHQLTDQYGIGVLADRPKRWPKAVQSVIERREELGADYRSKVDKNDLVIERRYEEWVNAWTQW